MVQGSGLQRMSSFFTSACVRFRHFQRSTLLNDVEDFCNTADVVCTFALLQLFLFARVVCNGKWASGYVW